MNPHSPDPTAPEAVQDFAGLWSALYGHAAARGFRNKAEWVRRAGELSARDGQEPRPVKTFYDRVAAGRRVAWDEARWLVAAVPGLEVAPWKSAWERAEAQWLANRFKARQPAEPAAPVVEPPAGAATAGRAPESVTVGSGAARPRRRLVPALAGAVVLCTVAAGALVAASAGGGTPPPVRADPVAPVEPVEPVAQAPAELEPPSSSATSAKSKAHAEFRRGTGEFLIYDDATDGRSAELQFRVDGAPAASSYNSRGKTDAAHPAKPFRPPAFVPGAVVEYRVCVVDYGSPVREQTCGAWTRDATS